MEIHLRLHLLRDGMSLAGLSFADTVSLRQLHLPRNIGPAHGPGAPSGNRPAA
jgi:hypothetical protein